MNTQPCNLPISTLESEAMRLARVVKDACITETAATQMIVKALTVCFMEGYLQSQRHLTVYAEESTQNLRRQLTTLITDRE